MQVGIIGAGKVGSALAVGLKNKGFRICGIYSRNQDTAWSLAARVDAPAMDAAGEVAKLSDVVFLAVSDTAVSDAAAGIAAQLTREDIRGRIFFHCSGALSSEALNVLADMGAVTASLHPLQTFADRETGWEGMSGIFFGFEGNEGAKNSAVEVANAFNGSMIFLDKENKPLYHAAACILSNYMVTLSYVAGNIFEKICIDRQTGINAFMPLIEKTLMNIKGAGALKALTGPISRGDHVVVENHIKELEARYPESVDFYKVLGGITTEMAVERGSISGKSAIELLNLLK